MSNKLIWAFFFQLSSHMWDDENTRSRGWYLPNATPPIGSYTPGMDYARNNYVDVELWDEMVDFCAERKYNMIVIDVGDGVKYDSHPEVSAPDAWDKDFLKKKLDEMRAKGIEPIPKLNFSACHHAWLGEYRRMVATPIYYKVCSDIIAEVCELFGNPRFMHLGLDEENAPNQAMREMTIVRHEDLWWHDVYFFFAECEKHGVRPWVWSDYYWAHPDLFVKNMPKSVLQSNWYYGRFQDSTASSSAVKTYVELDELGYEQVPSCSTWSTVVNPYQTVAHGKAKLSDKSLLGYMTIPWTYAHNRDVEFTLKDDAHRLYVARREIYPETL